MARIEKVHRHHHLCRRHLCHRRQKYDDISNPIFISEGQLCPHHPTMLRWQGSNNYWREQSMMGSFRHMDDGSMPSRRHAGIIDHPYGLVILYIRIEYYPAYARFGSRGSCGCPKIKAVIENTQLQHSDCSTTHDCSRMHHHEPCTTAVCGAIFNYYYLHNPIKR